MRFQTYGKTNELIWSVSHLGVVLEHTSQYTEVQDTRPVAEKAPVVVTQLIDPRRAKNITSTIYIGQDAVTESQQ